MSEPRPLRDADDLDVLRPLVERAVAMDIDADYDLEAGLSRHLAMVSVIPVASTANGARRAWWPWAVGSVVAGTAAAWLAFSPHAGPPEEHTADVVAVEASVEPSDQPTVAAPRSPPSSITASSSPPLLPPPTPSFDAPSPRQAPSSGRPKGPRPKPSATAPPRPGANDAIVREAANVAEVRRRLAAGEYGAAIAACAHGDREFPEGLLAVERGGLRILARLRQGGGDEARARARDYLATHPSGPVSSQIRGEL